jgi:hypothetical protein
LVGPPGSLSVFDPARGYIDEKINVMKHIKLFGQDLYESEEIVGYGVAKTAAMGNADSATGDDADIHGRIEAAMLDEEMTAIVGPVEDILQKNGFVSWGDPKYTSKKTGGKRDYKYLYILRRTPVPAHLVMVVGEPVGGNGPAIDIFFDDVIERKNHSRTPEEYETSNPIRQIEKVLGIDFEMHEKKGAIPGSPFTFTLYTGSIPKKAITPDQLRKVIGLYKSIKV